MYCLPFCPFTLPFTFFLLNNHCYGQQSVTNLMTPNPLMVVSARPEEFAQNTKRKGREGKCKKGWLAV